MYYDKGFGFPAASERLCATMRAGIPYSLKVDLASPTDVTTPGSPAPTPASLEIFGTDVSCSQGQLLWTSPPAGPTWKTFCATFTPTLDTTYIALTSWVASYGVGILYVDHIVPVATCP